MYMAIIRGAMYNMYLQAATSTYMMYLQAATSE